MRFPVVLRLAPRQRFYSVDLKNRPGRRQPSNREPDLANRADESSGVDAPPVSIDRSARKSMTPMRSSNWSTLPVPRVPVELVLPNPVPSVRRSVQNLARCLPDATVPALAGHCHRPHWERRRGRRVCFAKCRFDPVRQRDWFRRRMSVWRRW